MSLFTIQCTTCKARLAVKDESVIGDILSCPKCSSMVQVVPPPGWQRAASDDGASGELSDPGELSSTTIPLYLPSAKMPEKKTKQAAIVPPALPPRKPGAEAAPPQPAPVATDTATKLDTDVAEVPADESATSLAIPATAEQPAEATAASPTLLAILAARLRKDWLLWTGGLSAGVALGAAAWLVVWLQSPSPKVVAQSVAVPSNVQQAPSPSGDESSVVTDSPASDEPSPSSVSEPAPPATSEPVDAQQRPSPTTEQPSQPVAVASPEMPANDTDAPVADTPTPALKLDPVSSNQTPTDVGPADSEPSLVDSAATNPNADVTDNAVDSPAEDVPEDMLDQGSPGEPAPLSVVQIEQRLAVPIEQVLFEGVPLAQFASFIGDIAGVPVIIDDTSLQTIGKNRRLPIHVRLSRTTVLDTLQKAVQEAGLTYVIEDGRILISAPQR